MTTITTRYGAVAVLTLTLALTMTVSVQAAASADANIDGQEEAAPIPTRASSSNAGLLYSLPWQLRPLAIGNLARLEGAAAVFNDTQGNLDVAVATVLAGSYQLTREWAPMIRLGFVGNDAPGAALDGKSFANPVVGATYTRAVGSYELGFFGATTLPVGTGGGDDPNARAAKTNAASMVARPADSAMFAVDYLTAIVGADLAYVKHGLTVQVEATFLQFVRVRGSGADQLRTQAAAGLHLGYFIGSHFSLSGDVSYQRWLAHAATANALGLAVGPRAHFGLGRQASVRPGISFVRGLDSRGFDAPLLTAQTTAVQIDLPVTF